MREKKYKTEEYMDADPRIRVSFVWDLTKEVFSLSGDYDVKSRLQRNAPNFIRGKGWFCVGFDSASADKMIVDIGGHKIPIISKANLILNRQFTGRAKDMLDVKMLRKNKPPSNK